MLGQPRRPADAAGLRPCSVGSALDRSGLDGLLGTVAGDDTVLAIVAEAHGGREVADHLATLAGLRASMDRSSDKRVPSNGKG